MNDSGTNSPQVFGLHAQVIPALITSFTAAVEMEAFTINPGPHEVVCNSVGPTPHPIQIQ